MRSWRTAVALGVVIALAAAIYLIFKYEGLVYTGPTVGVIGLVLSVLVLVYNYWSKGRDSNPVEPPTPEQIEAAAEWLAGAVAGSWQKEAAARRIVTPAPVSVRWRWAGELTPEEAGRPLVTGAGPPSLPDADNSERILTSGVVTRLHDEVYKRLPRGRLVIIGDPGSGKTSALILLLLEALAWREKLPSAERSKVPVPVLLPLAGWNPASVSLAEWAASMLNRDYRVLQAPRYGNDAASALIGSGRVALFLDGLDEMPEKFRAEALRQLDTEGTALRIVMTSRPAEYKGAVRRAMLGRAAVIDLRPVRPAEAARFLLREQSIGNRAEWERVADYITANPDSPVAKALDNPLTLTMARDSYATGDPTAIMDSSSFPTEDEVAVHLIGQFLTRTYPDPRARNWLGFLARHLDGQGGSGSRDLEWWRLDGMLRPATRIMSVALATFVGGTLVGWIIQVPAFLTFDQPPKILNFPTMPDRLLLALVGGLLDGLLTGVVSGLGSIFVMTYRADAFGPSQVPLRLRGLRAMAEAFRSRNHAVRAASGFLTGLMTGLGYTVIHVLMDKYFYKVNISNALTMREIVLNATFFGILFGLTAGAVLFIVSVLVEPSDIGAAATPLGLIAENRSKILILAVIFAPLSTIIVAAGEWIAVGPLRDLLAMGSFVWSVPDALVVGGMVGFSAVIAYGPAFTAWGQWVLLARIVLPLTGRLPWKVTTFLDDAYKRGVLRQAGAVYQFRHLTLQAYLSREQAAGAGESRRMR